MIFEWGMGNAMDGSDLIFAWQRLEGGNSTYLVPIVVEAAPSPVRGAMPEAERQSGVRPQAELFICS